MNSSIKLLLGGSPCTHWSIAQTKNRETKPEGLGWELFRNYLIAREKYRPDYFLYENNKSMAPAIREQITAELGVEPVLINSALVSAQNRQRLYWVGKRNADDTYSRIDIEQPVDKGILLRDILDSGIAWKEKGYALDANYYKGAATPLIHQSGCRLMAAEPVGTTNAGKAYVLRAQYARSSVINALDGGHYPAAMVAEPVRIGTIESEAAKPEHDSQAYRVYSPNGKFVALKANGGGMGAKTGLYAVPCGAALRGRKDGSRLEIREDSKANSVIVGHQSRLVVEASDGKTYPAYEVKDGFITIKGERYPIKLADGYYIIRKLTVAECKRLQTVPGWYEFPVSNSQAYKMLGNGWTVDVISHILGHMDGLRDKPVEVLSMYDGMSCGQIALRNLGVDICGYYATETDKYAIQTTQHNFPDTVQLGDAFGVR